MFNHSRRSRLRPNTLFAPNLGVLTHIFGGANLCVPTRCFSLFHLAGEPGGPTQGLPDTEETAQSERV